MTNSIAQTFTEHPYVSNNWNTKMEMIVPTLDIEDLSDLHKKQAHQWVILVGCSSKCYHMCWNTEKLLSSWVRDEESKWKVLEMR